MLALMGMPQPGHDRPFPARASQARRRRTGSAGACLGLGPGALWRWDRPSTDGHFRGSGESSGPLNPAFARRREPGTLSERSRLQGGPLPHRTGSLRLLDQARSQQPAAEGVEAAPQQSQAEKRGAFRRSGDSCAKEVIAARRRAGAPGAGDPITPRPSSAGSRHSLAELRTRGRQARPSWPSGQAPGRAWPRSLRLAATPPARPSSPTAPWMSPAAACCCGQRRCRSSQRAEALRPATRPARRSAARSRIARPRPHDPPRPRSRPARSRRCWPRKQAKRSRGRSWRPARPDSAAQAADSKDLAPASLAQARRGQAGDEASYRASRPRNIRAFPGVPGRGSVQPVAAGHGFGLPTPPAGPIRIEIDPARRRPGHRACRRPGSVLPGPYHKYGQVLILEITTGGV